MRLWVVLLISTLAMAAGSGGGQAIAETVWRVTSVYDGDTIMIEVPALPPELSRLSVRLRGIDTPEIGGRAKCRLEREWGIAARDFVRERVMGREVRFTDLGWDKYGGRIDAFVWVDGGNLSEMLIAAGLARPYDGRSKRKGWC